MTPRFTPFTDGTQLTDIPFKIDENEKLILPESIKPSIESKWEQLTSNDSKLSNQALYRAVTVTENEIVVAPDIDYQKVVGIRNTLDFVGHFSDVPLPYALSLILFVYTSDGELVLVERFSGDWPNGVELPGAFTRPAWESGIYDQSLKVLEQDLGLEGEHVARHQAIGVLQNPTICKQMLIARFDLSLSLAALQLKSPKRVYALPNEYAIENHEKHFSLPLHIPSRQVMEAVAEHKGSI